MFHLKPAFGTDVDTAFLNQVLEADREVYPEKLVGSIKTLSGRYLANRDSYIFLLDDERNNQLAGYMHIAPMTEDFQKSVEKDSLVIRDDDVKPDEIAPYIKGGCHSLYLFSVLIRPFYRGKESTVMLTNTLKDFLKRKESTGYFIQSIYATAVSSDGHRFLTNLGFSRVRQLEDNYTVYRCSRKSCKQLMEGEIFKKD